MKTKFCFTILHVSILAAALLPLDVLCADECYVQIKVHRNTEYTAVLGEELKIKCPVTLCNDSPPEISWVKLSEDTHVPVNVSGGSHFKSEFTVLKHLEGESVLIIQNVIRNDSGIYWCESHSGVGHKIKVSVSGSDANNNKIKVSVNDTAEVITNKSTTSAPRRPDSEDPFWHFVYRVVGLMVFVVIVIAMFVTSHCLRKGVSCGGGSKDTPDPKSQTSHQALPLDQIYEGVQ